jgi:hypothetical protein
MGGQASTIGADIEKDVGEYEMQIHLELIEAVQKAGPASDVFLLARRIRPIPNTDGYHFHMPGPPRGNDLFDLFLRNLPAAQPPVDERTGEPVVMNRGQVQQMFDARWGLVVESTHMLRRLLHDLRVMHRLGYAHGDVKPENAVLVSVDGKPQVRLIDFDQSGRLDDQGRARWSEANATKAFNAACTLESRRIGPLVTGRDYRGNMVAETHLGPPTAEDDLFRALCGYHRLVTAIDPDVATHSTWPESLLFGPGGGLDRLLAEPQPEDRPQGRQQRRQQGRQLGRQEQGRRQPGRQQERKRERQLGQQRHQPPKRSRPQQRQVQGASVQELVELVHAAATGHAEAEAELRKRISGRVVGPGVRARLELAITLGRMMLEVFNIAAQASGSDKRKAGAWSTLTKLFAPGSVDRQVVRQNIAPTRQLPQRWQSPTKRPRPLQQRNQ